MIDLNPYNYLQEEWQAEIDRALFAGRARREAKRILLEEESPSQPIPPAKRLTDMMKEEIPTVRYRVEGWQPVNSKVVMVAQGKSGKSCLSHNLVRCLVDGDKFLKFAPVHRIEGTVTIIDFEMPESKINEWLRKQGIEHHEQVNVFPMRGRGGAFNILDPACRAVWVEKLAEQDSVYVILDCLRPVLDALSLDEHRDAGKFFGAFDALLAEAGITEACVIHHMGHAGERSRGDSRIVDWPDASWSMFLSEPGNPHSERFIRAFGRDVNISERKVTMDDTNHHMSVERGGRHDRKTLDALDAVMSVLKEQREPVNQRTVLTALRDNTEYSRRDVVKALDLGIWQGHIEDSKGRHNSTMYEVPQTWAKRAGGGEGGEHDSCTLSHQEE